MTRVCVLAALSAFALSASAAPVPKHLMKNERYWPTAVGTKWVYVRDGKEFTEEITKVEARKDGTLRLTLQVRNWDEVVDVAPDGVTHRTAVGQFTWTR